MNELDELIKRLAAIGLQTLIGNEEVQRVFPGKVSHAIGNETDFHFKIVGNARISQQFLFKERELLSGGCFNVSFELEGLTRTILNQSICI